MSGRLVAGVALLWTLVAVVIGVQESFGAALQGRTQPIGPAVLSALHQSLPWIPGTLAVVALATRFPVTQASWRTALPVHLVAMPVVAFGTNVLVVLGYWFRFGAFQGIVPLVREGARWGLVRIHVAVLLYAAAAGLTQIVQSRRTLKRRELEVARLQADLAEARLQVLNAQIRPHFLFNTLHAIGQLWRSGRGDEADAMLDHLGALFQKVISSTSRPRVSLEEELQMVRDYLAIEQVRFEDRMTSRIEAEAPALAWPVPPLVLQPLVENAVKHGISDSAAAGELVVRAHVADGHLVVEVTDDGRGGAASTSRGSGTGLANVRERLRSIYGGDELLEAGPRADGGWRVRVRIPARGDGA